MHDFYMRKALNLAQQAAELGEVPIGAVVVLNDEIIGQGFNAPISNCDPSAHAEIIAIREAASNIDNYRLPDSRLYVTVEPCTMCAGLLIHARIKHLIYGAPEPRSGAINSCDNLLSRNYHNHKVTVTGGVLADECADLMRNFFKQRRKSR